MPQRGHRLQLGPLLLLEQCHRPVKALQPLFAGFVTCLDVADPGGNRCEVDVLTVAAAIVNDANQSSLLVHQGASFGTRGDGGGELNVSTRREVAYARDHTFGNANAQSECVGQGKDPASDRRRLSRLRNGEGVEPRSLNQAQVALAVAGENFGVEVS
ncbi:hypothetical protein FQZ97_875870 [compost metagenome]